MTVDIEVRNGLQFTSTSTQQSHTHIIFCSAEVSHTLRAAHRCFCMFLPSEARSRTGVSRLLSFPPKRAHGCGIFPVNSVTRGYLLWLKIVLFCNSDSSPKNAVVTPCKTQLEHFNVPDVASAEYLQIAHRWIFCRTTLLSHPRVIVCDS